MALSPLQYIWCHLEGDSRTSGRRGTRWRAAQEQTLEREDLNLRYFVQSSAQLTISVPLDLRLVAVQSRVDDDRAPQTHGLTLSSKRYAKLVDDVSLEGDAILRHWALCR